MSRKTSFILLTALSFSLLVFSFSFVSAQDAIQCTPTDVKLIRDLHFPNNNNIYLGTGHLNFSDANANIYAARDTGGNLLFRNAGAQIITQSKSVLFQDPNITTDRLAGIYRTNPGVTQEAKLLYPLPLDQNPFFIVNGTIEGYKVNGLNQLCIKNSCITSWPVDTDNQSLSFDGDTGILTISKSGSQVTITGDGGGGGGITEIQDGDGAGVGISVVNVSSSIVSLSAAGGSAGVSKITVGSGLTIASLPDTAGNPISGTGAVTINMSGSSPCVAGFIRSGNMCLAGGLNGSQNLNILAIREIYNTDTNDPRSLTNDPIDFDAAKHPAFATLDIPALNGTNAKFAMIRALCAEANIYVRKVESTIPARYATGLGNNAQQSLLCSAGDNDVDWGRFNNIFYVELNSDKDIQWSVYAVDPDTLDAGLYLVGYID